MASPYNPDYSQNIHIVRVKLTVAGLSAAVFCLFLVLITISYIANLSNNLPVYLNSEESLGILAIALFIFYAVTRYLFRARTGHSLKYPNDERLSYYGRAINLLIIPTILASGLGLFIGLFGNAIYASAYLTLSAITILSFYPTSKNIIHHLELEKSSIR